MRSGVQAHRPPLPSILLANVQSLENKLDDIRVRIQDCNIICLTETWLNPLVPDRVILSHETRVNGGVCFMTNKWCNPKG